MLPSVRPMPTCRFPTYLSLQGEQLHGPLVERLLELPMDIHEGRVTGELRLRCHDTPSWQFPEIWGRLKCSGEAVCGLRCWEAVAGRTTHWQWGMGRTRCVHGCA